HLEPTPWPINHLDNSVSHKHKRIVGVDVWPEMIAFAEQNHKPMDSVQYLIQDLSQSWDSLSPELKALESKSRLMHVVSKLLAKNGEFVAIYIRAPDVMSLLTSEQIKQYNIQLQTKSESQQLDEIQTACSDNGLNVTKVDVSLLKSRVNKYAIKALRPDATALNPHAYDQLAHKWDTNGPEVPTYYHSIHVEFVVVLDSRVTQTGAEGLDVKTLSECYGIDVLARIPVGTSKQIIQII
ncbi:unnamed protein product, partial [Medioppia subpectinata]